MVSSALEKRAGRKEKIETQRQKQPHGYSTNLETCLNPGMKNYMPYNITSHPGSGAQKEKHVADRHPRGTSKIHMMKLGIRPRSAEWFSLIPGFQKIDSNDSFLQTCHWPHWTTKLLFGDYRGSNLWKAFGKTFGDKKSGLNTQGALVASVVKP